MMQHQPRILIVSPVLLWAVMKIEEVVMKLIVPCGPGVTR